MAVKQWTQPDGKHFRGLCQNEFWPVVGAGGCNICASPVFSVSQGICGCGAKEIPLARSFQITVAAGPSPHPELDESSLLASSAYGVYNLSTNNSFADDIMYDASTDQFINAVPRFDCNTSCLPKIVEIPSPVPGGFPGVFSWSVRAQFGGPSVNGLKKSWNGIFIYLSRQRWRKVFPSDNNDWRYMLDRDSVVTGWQHYLQGPFPRCQSRFSGATGLSSFVTSTWRNIFNITVDSGT